MESLRGKVLAFAKEKYGTLPERLWGRFPGYEVLRHEDNQKWYALIMDVPGSKLGLEGEGLVDILNVKLADPVLCDVLSQREGFLRGYHIQRGNWISIRLDGTVPREEVFRWLEESFLNTCSREMRQKLRPPKDWLIPANPKYFDIEAAFEEKEEIPWKQGKGIKKMDRVYVYVAAPVGAILFQCLVTETDIPCHLPSKEISIESLMNIRLLKRYPRDRFSFERLGREYGIHAIRGPRGVPEGLLLDLKEEEN